VLDHLEKDTTAVLADGRGLPPFEATLSIRYTLSTGVAAGRFLTELARRRIVGARCTDCSRVLVPAEEYCPRCGGDASELLEMPQTGAVTAFTARNGQVLALIRIDGADTDLLHRVLGATIDDLVPGQRVIAVWADEPEGGSILDLAGFRIAEGEADAAAPKPLEVGEEAAISELPYGLDLHYEHAYGTYYGRLFDELRTTRRIIGVRCPSCQSVLVPPRPVCEACYVPTAQFEDVADTGTLRAFSVIRFSFEGQVREPPYVYAEITLDGAATRVIHLLGGIDVESAHETLRPGLPVRAVWRDDSHTGTLTDIAYFEPVVDD
jgi:uncharacterized OB-fold protein